MNELDKMVDALKSLTETTSVQFKEFETAIEVLNRISKEPSPGTSKQRSKAFKTILKRVKKEIKKSKIDKLNSSIDG